MYLLGILPISSVRMRLRAGFRAFSYVHAQRRRNSAPTQRPQASLLSERRNAGAGQRLYARRRSTHDRKSSKDPARYHHGHRNADSPQPAGRSASSAQQRGVLASNL